MAAIRRFSAPGDIDLPQNGVVVRAPHEVVPSERSTRKACRLGKHVTERTLAFVHDGLRRNQLLHGGLIPVSDGLFEPVADLKQSLLLRRHGWVGWWTAFAALCRRHAASESSLPKEHRQYVDSRVETCLQRDAQAHRRCKMMKGRNALHCDPTTRHLAWTAAVLACQSWRQPSADPSDPVPGL